VVHPSCSLLHLFRKFLQHKMNLALVVNNPPVVRKLYKEVNRGVVDLPASTVVYGMITIEDVIEELIQEVCVCVHVRVTLFASRVMMVTVACDDMMLPVGYRGRP
jgi:hypothetical protein